MKTRLLVLTFVLTVSVAGYSNPDIENAQAMYIYNFLRLIKWTENSVQDEFVIGIYGNSNISEYLLKYTNNRAVGQKKIKVIHVNSMEASRGCQLLFVTRTKSSEINEIVTHPNLRNTLIITESSGLTDKGAAIEFAVVDNKLKFKINEMNAKKHHLIISKALLDMSI